MLTLIGTWAQANLRLKLKYQAGASQRSARVHGVLSIPCVQGVKRQPFTGLLNLFTLMWKIQVDDEAPNKMLSSALIPGFDWEFDADEVFLKIKFFLFLFDHNYCPAVSHLSQGHWSQLLGLQGLLQAQYQLLRSSMSLSWVST